MLVKCRKSVTNVCIVLCSAQTSDHYRFFVMTDGLPTTGQAMIKVKVKSDLVLFKVLAQKKN